MTTVKSRYFAGDVGQAGGKLHLFPAREGVAVLATVCPVDRQVGYLRRVDVDESAGPATLDELLEDHGEDLCLRCRDGAGSR